MAKYKYIKITKLNEQLINKNIGLNYGGLLIYRRQNVSSVLVFNKFNLGEFCTTEIENNCFEVFADAPKGLEFKTTEFLKGLNHLTSSKLSLPKFKEFDVVELTVENEAYAQHGVHKGAIGTIMEDKAINNKWGVIFSDAKTGKDIANLCINQDHLKLKKN